MSKHLGLLDLRDTSKEKILQLFQLANELSLGTSVRSSQGQSAILLFLEPSTRTRVSFEMACHREGIHPVIIQGKSATSLEKEETLEDTFLNLAAMKPVAIVVRAGDEYDFSSVRQKIEVPIINAGWGTKGHPTQALLDAWTLYKKWKDLKGRRLLIIGDVAHSRVAQSHFELSSVLGYEVKIFAPPAFLPKNKASVVSSMTEGLQWCDAVMALRSQKERHQTQFASGDFNTEWRLNAVSIKNLKKDSWIMHPGPVNWGIELSQEIQKDPRSIILDQVNSGLYLRQALIRMCQAGQW